MDLSIYELIRRLIREAWGKRKLVISLFVVISFVFLMLALRWPKVFTSSSTILVDQQNILRPLMEGTAVTTNAIDRANIAKEVVHSRKSMVKLIDSANWFDDEPTALERDLMIESIKKRTEFKNVGDNLIRISFRDADPKRAFETTKLMTEIFIDESLRTKQAESRDAYEFINSQADEYRKKLQSAENAIKRFRSKNVDASPTAEAAVDARILQLKRQLETVGLEIYQEKSKLDARLKQLSGESGTINAGSLARENQLSTRIEELQIQLANLRLTYMDSYPDIIQLKNQIATLDAQIDAEIEARKSGKLTGTTELRNGPIAQDLRRQVLRARTNISSLGSKEEQLQKLLTKEWKAREDINAVKAEIAELTRDYDVNQQMYQRLLSQRENAYVSMNIDIKNQGLSIKVQESANLPVTPKGIRFAHIVLAGLALSIMIPLGVAFGLSLVDQKVRDPKVISDELGLPILASLYSVVTPHQKRMLFFEIGIFISIVFSVWGVYGYQIYLRMTGIV